MPRQVGGVFSCRPLAIITSAIPHDAQLHDPAADRQHEQARRHPERETLELATAGAAQLLGPDHGVTKALAKAAVTIRRGFSFVLSRATIGSWKDNK